MSRAALVFIIAACLVLAGSPANAQDALLKRISLDLKAMAPSQAFRVIAELSGMGVTVSPEVTAPVDILVHNVTTRTALDAICQSIGCRWTILDDVLSVTPADSPPRVVTYPDIVWTVPGKTGGSVEQKKVLLERLQAAMKQTLPAGLTFDKSPLAVVSARLSAVTGLTIVLSAANPAVTTLTADLSGQTLLSALQALGKSDPEMMALRLTVSDKGSSGAPSVMLGFKVAGKKE